MRKLYLFGAGVGTGAVIVLALVLSVILSGTEDEVSPIAAVDVSQSSDNVFTENTSTLATSAAPDDVQIARATGGRATTEGIQVHGSWTIDVLNPDGSLAGHHEFENAFFGEDILASVLAREWLPIRWDVLLLDEAFGDNQICGGDLNGVFTRANCLIQENVGTGFSAPPPADNTAIFNTLTREVFANDETFPETFLVLNGSAVAAFDGELADVITRITYADNCGENYPDDCSPIGDTETFTAKDLDPPIPVLEGQQVLVNIVLDFD